MIIGLALSIVLAVPYGVRAEVEQSDEQAAYEPGSEAVEWEFRDDVIDLPKFPDFDKLEKVKIDASFGKFDFFVDPASISVGVNEVVYVTIIMTSARGARNILFEGYRCDTREFRTYAYGTSNDTFYELVDSQWELSLRSKGTTYDFRRELLSTYLCNIDRTTPDREEILRLIKYPAFRNDEGREF